MNIYLKKSQTLIHYCFLNQHRMLGYSIHQCQLLATHLHKAILLHWCRLVKDLHPEICINAAFGKSVYQVLLEILNWYRRRLQLVK